MRAAIGTAAIGTAAIGTAVSIAGLAIGAKSLGVESSASAQRKGVVRTRRGGPRSLRVVGRVHTGIQPKSVALSPDGRRLVVCNFGRPDRNNVRVYSANDLSLLGSIHFPGNAVEAAFSSDGRTLYISNFRRHVIEVVDVEKLEVVREVRAGNNPKVIALSPSGRRAYVANWSSDNVTEIDTRQHRVRRHLETMRHPRGIAIMDSGRLFVASMYSHLIQVFDRGARTERTHFTPCRFPRHLVLSPDQRTLYVSCSCCRQVRWFNTQTYRLEGIATTGKNPRSLALSADGRYLVAAGFDDSTLTLIDTHTHRHRVHDIPRAKKIVGIALRPATPTRPLRIYATSWLTGELIALSPDG